MRGHTRISSKLDTSRLGQAISRPGIDPRAWVTLAIALDESKVDPAYGVFVNVQFMPTGEKYTATVPAGYAGKGFGFYAPIHKDDDIVVMIPLGDPRLGVVVVGRLWTAADTPPTEAVTDPDEVMLIVEKDHNLRLKVTGTGKVEVDSDDTVTLKSPKVRLGDEAATEQLVLGTTYRTNETTSNTAVQAAHTAANVLDVGAAAQFAVLANAAVGPLAALKPGFLALQALFVAAAPPEASAASAIGAFEGGAANYLSPVSNTK